MRHSKTSLQLVSDPWAELTKIARKHPAKSYVAVAYFGTGGSKMLPLGAGSVLVVNASPACVRCGQTNPTDLLKLRKRKVRIYSVANLHAKVYVFGKTAYVGSPNVSSYSKNWLCEVAFKTTEAANVRACREYVKDLAADELLEEQLKKLIEIYKPPKPPPGAKNTGALKSAGRHRSVLSRVLVSSLDTGDYAKDELAAEKEGMPAAEKQVRLENAKLDTFVCNNALQASKFRKGDVVIAAVRYGHHIAFEPPARILLMKTIAGKPVRTVVFVEKAKGLKSRKYQVVAKEYKNSGASLHKALDRGTTVCGGELARRLLQMWKTT